MLGLTQYIEAYTLKMRALLLTNDVKHGPAQL